MALKHAQPLEVIELHAGADAGGASVSTSLLKTAHLQLMRVVLPAGQGTPEHHVAGEITIQCLEGEAEVVTATHACRLLPGRLVMLPGAEAHRVHAHRDSVLLVTLLHP